MANEDELQAALDAARRAETEAQRLRIEAQVEAERLREEARRYTDEANAIASGRRPRHAHRRHSRRVRREWRWHEPFTLKASAVLATIAVWAASVASVAIRPDSWPILIFAGLTTMMIGANAWRRLGLSRLLAITGIWAGAAVIAAVDEGRAWPALFALFTTGTVVFSGLGRNAWLQGLAIAAPWLATGAAVGAQGGEVAWMVVVGWLSAMALANTRRRLLRSILTLVWWNATGVAVVVGGADWAWLSFGALILAWFPLGFGGFGFTRGFEWDLWQKDRGNQPSMAGSNDG